MSSDAIEVISRAFAERGGDVYGERVSQLDHALQCALIAQEEGASDQLVAAALLHDIGHLFESRGDAAELEGRDARHEAHGARMLKPWFGPEVAGPVGLHVAAKRYLCATEPAYEAALSEASKLSLRLQGGAFTPAQCRRFEAARHAADAVRLRRWDDAGKVAGRAVPALDAYWPLLVRISLRRDE
ncbi:MAG TPA: HD domain-containing protein [Caulobacteraceae bacterium]|nr:HD domain-containing protein [Caulobacteraceae bacterium]